MSFTKEYIPRQDKELFNSFKMYDYDKQIIRKWQPFDKWVADRKRRIYFLHIGGSANLEQAPQQYDLIWKNRIIVIFVDNYSSYDVWNLINIYAPKELQPYETKMIKLIKTVAEKDHKVDFYNGGYIYYKTKRTVNNLKISYKDEVM